MKAHVFDPSRDAVSYDADTCTYYDKNGTPYDKEGYCTYAQS